VEEEVVVVEGVVEVEVVCSTQRAEKPEEDASSEGEPKERKPEKNTSPFTFFA
jgi:hypothetical protein